MSTVDGPSPSVYWSSLLASVVLSEADVRRREIWLGKWPMFDSSHGIICLFFFFFCAWLLNHVPPFFFLSRPFLAKLWFSCLQSSGFLATLKVDFLLSFLLPMSPHLEYLLYHCIGDRFQRRWTRQVQATSGKPSASISDNPSGTGSICPAGTTNFSSYPSQVSNAHAWLRTA